MESKAVRLYSSVYSGIQVLEAMVRGIAVMKRKSDGYVNATQILKVAGVEKGKRTKILEKDITNGEHEKIQGGYGKYQGTWIPLDRGRDLASQYGVGHLLSPIFDAPPTNATDAFPPPSRPLSAAQQRQRVQSSDRQTPSHASASRSYGRDVPSSPSLVEPRDESRSALALLQKTRAQGLFSRPASAMSSAAVQGRLTGAASRDAMPEKQNLKRDRPSDLDVVPNTRQPRPPHAGTAEGQLSNGDFPPPAKRPRVDPARAADKANGMALDMQTIRAPSELGQTVSGQALVGDDIDQGSARPASQRDSLLLAIYAGDAATVLSILSTHARANSDVRLDIDTVIDDEGHTALHWAGALARQPLVEALVRGGADVSKGNAVGETPLIRSVMSCNNYDQQSFQSLVETLNTSIRTLDHAGRSVLHHIVYLSGVKGRAAAARYYMQVLFDWIARHQGGDFRSLVDVQDVHGDTALNIAARIGSRGLVRMLLDVGANRGLANKLDLRPGDFGVEGENLQHPHVEDVFSSLRTNKSAPIQRSNTIVSGMTAKIENLTSEFTAEVQAKQDAIQMNQVHLRAATRQLAEQRRQIQLWQGKCADLDQAKQRVRNVQRALVEEEQFDWTGRTELDVMRGIDISFDLEPDPPVPTGDSAATLVKLRRIKAWSSRSENILSQRLARLKGASAEKEVQCKKIVSICTKVPVEDVEQMLEQLLIAVESDSDAIDLDRVSGFLSKVRNGNI